LEDERESTPGPVEGEQEPPLGSFQDEFDAFVADLKRFHREAAWNDLKRMGGLILRELRVGRGVAAGEPPPPTFADMARDAATEAGVSLEQSVETRAAVSEPSEGESTSTWPDETDVSETRDADAPPGQPIRPAESPERMREMLEIYRTREEAKEEDYENQLRTLQGRRSIVFWLQLFFAVATGLLAIVGVVLVLAGSVAVGVVSAAVAILPGAGTVALRRQAGEVAQQQTSLTDDQARLRQWRQTIELVNSIQDPGERDRKVIDLAHEFIMASKKAQGA
jgi:hypothetical protein